MKTFKNLAEEWFDEYAKFKLRSTTYERMELLRDRTYEALGNKLITKITTKDIQLFINSLATDGANKKTGAPLSAKTITHYYTFISDVFNFAESFDMIKSNPCKNVVLPRKVQKEKKIYSQEEVSALLEKLKGEPLKYQAFFYLAAYSGFRRGEMLGLEWKDIDFDENIISVNRTSNYTPERGIYTDVTKTLRSERTIKVSEYIIDILIDLHEEQLQEMKEYKGKDYIYSDRLFIKSNGGPMYPSTPYAWLKKFCTRNNFPFYGVHTFRHFAASALISAGLDVAPVARTLGHSTPGTTLSIYSHAFNTAQAKAAAAMDNAFLFLSQDKNKSVADSVSEKGEKINVADSIKTLQHFAEQMGKHLKIEFI